MMNALSFDITTRFTDSALHLAKQRAEIKDEVGKVDNGNERGEGRGKIAFKR